MASPSPWSLMDAETGKTVVRDLFVADSFLTRLNGLQFQDKMNASEGLILIPCRSVHTFMMRFSLDLLMLDDQGTVLTVHRNVKPWQVIFGARNIHAVVEVNGNTADVQAGTRLYAVAREENTSPLPLSMNFLVR